MSFLFFSEVSLLVIFAPFTNTKRQEITFTNDISIRSHLIRRKGGSSPPINRNVLIILLELPLLVKEIFSSNTHLQFIVSSGSLNEADMAPPAYIKKYNKFVDSILDRVNKILRRAYDPVNVRLQTVYEAKKSTTKKNKKKKNKNKNGSKERRNEA